MRLRAVATTCLLALLTAPASAGTIDLVRDRWGVPHIFVPPTISGRIAQIRALGFAQGYATAQDRMVQLEFFRRAGHGRLSEIAFLGPSFIPMDIAARRDGLTNDERRALIGRLPGRIRVAFKGFAGGVNQFLADITADPSKAPAEFGLLGLKPEPWDVVDTLAVAEIEIRRFGQNGGDEIGNARILLDLLDQFPAAEAKGIFSDTFWLEDATAPTTIDPHEQVFEPSPLTPFAPAQMALITAHASAIRGTAMALASEHEMLASLAPEIGLELPYPPHASNAMVVSGALTATGHPILLGGPQTGLSLPSFFHEVGLHGAGYDAEGVTVPAGTGLVIGRTQGAAWTLTSGITDNTDVYIETLNPSNPKQYMFNGAFRNMTCRTETFTPASRPIEMHEFCRTVHGPVFESYPSDGVAFARRFYLFGRELDAAVSLVSLGFAHNIRQFQHTMDKNPASLNCMYADTAGHIAYFHRGIRPRRPPTMDPRLPLPGTGEAEARGIITGRRMPTAIDPKLGFIAQWNNKPIAGWSADEQRELWGGADRVQILIDQLAAAKAAAHPITPDDVVGYMRKAATTDFFAPRVFPFLQAAVDALPAATADEPQLESATALVQDWLGPGGGALLTDASGNIPYPGVTIYRAWRTQVQLDTFGDELGTHVRTMRYFQTSNGSNGQDDSGLLQSPDALFLRALQGGPTAPVPTSRDYFRNVTANTNPGRDATLVNALRTALATLQTQFGTADMTQWLTPKIVLIYSATSAADILYGQTKQERQDRGTINEIIDLSPTPSARIVVPPGETGLITLSDLSTPPPHLRDQLPVYTSFDFHSMPMTLGELEGPTTTQTLTLP